MYLCEVMSLLCVSFVSRLNGLNINFFFSFFLSSRFLSGPGGFPLNAYFPNSIKCYKCYWTEQIKRKRNAKEEQKSKVFVSPIYKNEIKLCCEMVSDSWRNSELLVILGKNNKHFMNREWNTGIATKCSF